jgi:hypothetical protein
MMSSVWNDIRSRLTENMYGIVHLFFDLSRTRTIADVPRKNRHCPVVSTTRNLAFSAHYLGSRFCGHPARK